MPFTIDTTLYPETEAPPELIDLSDQVDFLARLCAAWDFGLLPEMSTIREIRHAVESCQLLTSPTYHLVREWHGLSPLPYLGQQLAYIRQDPNLAYI